MDNLSYRLMSEDISYLTGFQIIIIFSRTGDFMFHYAADTKGKTRFGRRVINNKFERMSQTARPLYQTTLVCVLNNAVC